MAENETNLVEEGVLVPAPPVAVSTGEQSVDMRLQNYPQLRGLLVRADTLTEDMGVSVADT